MTLLLVFWQNEQENIFDLCLSLHAIAVSEYAINALLRVVLPQKCLCGSAGLLNKNIYNYI